ncbi:hypothetical protein JCM6882_000655 [Rhodosporidiobolus microsporus]
MTPAAPAQLGLSTPQTLRLALEERLSFASPEVAAKPEQVEQEFFQLEQLLRAATSSRSVSPPSGHRPPLPSRHPVHTQPVRLYLGHLAVGTSERDIKRLFAQEDVSVLDVSLFTRYEPCFAFCTVASPTEASHALRFLDSSILNSSRIGVNRVTHVKGSSTLPRVVVEGLPSEFETLDVLRLAEEHAAEPRRVKCEVAAAGGARGGRGECVGSFRVEGKEEAEKAVRSLNKALGMYEQIRVWWDYSEAKDELPRTPPRGGDEVGGRSGFFVDDHRHDRPPLPPPPPPSFTYSSSPASSRYSSTASRQTSNPSLPAYRPLPPRRPPTPPYRRYSPPPRGTNYPYPRYSPPHPPPPPPAPSMYRDHRGDGDDRGGWSRDGTVHGAEYGSGVGGREGRDAEWAASRYGGGWTLRGGEKGPEWAR